MTSRHGLVVGGSSEIGRAIAVDLAQQGYELTLWGRDRARLLETAGLCGASGQRCAVDVIDVTDRVTTRGGLDRILADGDLSVAVWAAGTFDWAPADEADPVAWERVLDINLTSAAVFTTLVLPPLLQAAPSALVSSARLLAAEPLRTTRRM